MTTRRLRHRLAGQTDFEESPNASWTAAPGRFARVRRDDTFTFGRERAIHRQRWQRGDDLVLRDVTRECFDEFRAE